MTKTNKRLLTLLFAGFLAICAGFALLLARPANSASAEETTETPTYSETWVINEKWQPLEEEQSGSATYWDIAGKAGDEIFKQIYHININPAMIFIVNDKTESYGRLITDRVPESENPDGTTDPASYSFRNFEEKTMPYSGWKDSYGKITFYEDTSEAKFATLRKWLEVNATPDFTEGMMYVVYCHDGEEIINAVSIAGGKKLSEGDFSAISTEKEGYTFKGWSLTNGGEVIDLDAVTVTGDINLYAVYKKNAEPSEPTEPTEPENPDKNFEDKVKDFGDKASTWIKDNIGVSISGGAVIIILIVAALVIVFKRK